MEKENVYLFVYGTLLQQAQHPMGHYLAQHAENIGKGFILGKMYQIGAYPGVIASQNPREKVVGMVVQLIDAQKILPRLDAYEGFGDDCEQPNEFVREKVNVWLENGQKTEAWAYFYNWPTHELRQIISGDFLKK